MDICTFIPHSVRILMIDEIVLILPIGILTGRIQLTYETFDTILTVSNLD